jgi:hypothetical protein
MRKELRTGFKARMWLSLIVVSETPLNSLKCMAIIKFQRTTNKLLGHLICLFTQIINIYGLGVGISTIIKFTSDRGGV